MDINSIMSSQLAELQQTLQMSLMDTSMNAQAGAVAQLLEAAPQAPAAQHPYKGSVIDVSV